MRVTLANGALAKMFLDCKQGAVAAGTTMTGKW
jgi:hypothetical protein